MKSSIKITEEIFENLKSKLENINEDIEGDLAVCLSVITYQYSILYNDLINNDYMKRNYDIAMQGELYERLFGFDY
tara:strand:+ start:1307 stop:1534 length:228 start_codon:yes stop_codon:yes gene_type:complete